MNKTDYEKGFNNGFKACKDKLNKTLNDCDCGKCLHAEVCNHRTTLNLSFGNIIGDNSFEWKQVVYMIAIVCQYYKQKERSD